ncbi:5-formyltetrahydrofolate cyclo-ligase [uncultured Prevotella sp.]|uniref:5-formyltetrahydrofolate cyclo-ligase n=1 Tax=uncultured Prevotella sp. TaxID=159272 RepID=UPI00258273DE|nr:5-formyltetrahydrofolate cyclo-ligase [uncultured Prevotella sp.]
MLRAQMREAKKQHQAQLARMSEDIVRKLQGMMESRNVRTVMAYWPLSDEVDIRPLVDQLAALGVSVVLPKVTGDETMELRHYASREDLEEGAFHIMEPVGEPFIAFDLIDFALVPGMAFDAAGHRLGRGKGYYDRFLSTHPDIYKIGVCFPFQRVTEVPSEAHDVVMDEVIS